MTLDRNSVVPGLWSAAFCLLVLLVLGPPPSAWGASNDLAANPGSLSRVANDYRPRFRWWWPADSVQAAELREELRAIKGVGSRAWDSVP